MIRRVLCYLGLMLGAGLLIAADYSLPAAYWDAPKAKNQSGAMHNWSDLEQNLRPEACAQCHYEQFDAWKGSLHAHAYSNGMVGQFPAIGHASGNRCLSCHAPLQEQAYTDAEDMMASLQLKLTHPEPVDIDANLENVADMPLRHTGVSCAACHVRGFQRYGPPRAGSSKTGHIKTDVHGGFRASRDFEQSGFCASCHQFPQRRAINGKPLENTVREWEQSSFASKGMTCQACHMPFRRHLFRGIHDPETVRKGVNIRAQRNADGMAEIEIHSTGVGHAFPTYVTPLVEVRASALDRHGKPLKSWKWDIVREVEYRQQWVELRDTRIMPDEKRRYQVDAPPPGTRSVRFTVRVIPDHFYRGLYQRLLQQQPGETSKKLLQAAEKHTHETEFTLFEQTVRL